MATFDGQNRIITLDSGVTDVDVEIDLYSAWKEFVKVGDNAKFALAFRTIGGDSLTPGIDAGAFFFLRNDLGWRIKPPEEDITITVTGNLAPEDSSLPMLIPTDGDFSVLIAGLQPITQSVDTILTDIQALSTSLDKIEQIVAFKTITDPITGKQTIYDSDGTTILFERNIFEDAGGTQPYRGQGVERAEEFS